MTHSTSKALLLAFGGLLMFAAASGVLAGEGGDDNGDDPVRLNGGTRLSPPEGAENEDATGFAFLRQRGERSAIHIYVRHLAPGTTYDVVASLGEETAELGMITTRDGTPPPPRCFKASLTPPVSEEEGDGEAGHRRRRGDRDADGGPRGRALVYINRERTGAYYEVVARGLSGEPTGVTLSLGDDAIALESRRGRIDLSEEQIAALVGGAGSVSIATEAHPDGEISGALEECFPKLRERLAARRAGSGALRIDTAREDELPFEATSISDLVGITIRVLAGETVVLEGTVDEIREWASWRDRHHDGDGHGDRDGDDGAGGGGSGGEESDEFFAVAEPHDASFRRGDANDDGQFNVADPIAMLNHLFAGGPGFYCKDAADADDNGKLDISDPIYMLASLFGGGAPIPSPHESRGFDREIDALFCGPEAAAGE